MNCRPDWIYVLIAGAIALLTILAAFTAVAITLALNGPATEADGWVWVITDGRMEHVCPRCSA